MSSHYWLWTDIHGQ